MQAFFYVVLEPFTRIKKNKRAFCKKKLAFSFCIVYNIFRSLRDEIKSSLTHRICH